jgi:DeoR family transcriptional regulator of aga operon/DeoR family fructose operon transcriptional repressor
MVAAAREVIAIVDHTKWERAAFATFCATDRISSVLTDRLAPDAMVRMLTSRGVGVRLIAPAPGAGSDAANGLGATGSAP